MSAINYPVPESDPRERGEADGHGSKVKESARIKKKTRLMKASAAGEGSSGTPPPPVRFPLYPKSGTARDVVKWSVACRKLHKERAKDPRLKLSTVREPQDPETTEAVQNPKDKKTVIHAARSIVSISSVGHDGMKIRQCSGIIFCTHEGKVIVATSSLVVCKMGRLLDPLPRVSIRLSDADRTTLDGELVFFDYHYDLALLAIEVPFPVKVADSGSCPRYGQEIYALARGEESDLMVRHGIVKYHDESGFLGRDYYFFLDCEIPEEGTGGSVVDLEGKTIGMTLRMSPHPAVVSITTMEICIAMALQFGRIARPLHGLSLRSISFLDVELLDELSSCYDIDTGFIVDRVSHGSVAERLGIEYGDVICSFGLQTSTLPELEDHLLDLGLKYLQHPESTSELKVRVCSLLKRSGRSISLPITFCTKKVSYVRMRQ